MAKIATPTTKPFYVFNGFEAGLKPKVIINMKNYNGQNYFLIKWWKTKDPTFVKSEVANARCPLLVCKFYQKHTIFKGATILFKGKRNLT
ncbi:unnamed protein product [Macrosiphum euphorbiae]|uniref:Chromo shadow domain-containing protein n=1 Tax=Macrosiphum euphorbiae TaxID=13131 RepID=A0AAV0WD27_9HEMI|nr:unnamed protein product [Macrosiphum euphorbiae]